MENLGEAAENGIQARQVIILKEELSRAKELGVEISISRTGCGKFGGVKWKDIGKLIRA